MTADHIMGPTGPLAIRIGYRMTLEVERPTPIVHYLYTHPSRQGDLLQPDEVVPDRPLRIETFRDIFGNKAGRAVLPAGATTLTTDSVIVDPFDLDAHAPSALQLPLPVLPVETLSFLRPSRYVESDRLSDAAWQLFGGLHGGWERVQAICDWVHDNVEFGYAHTRVHMSAWDVYCERKGVCRDFMHLAIAFCRALNIPARYATGYLGDIDIEPEPFPMDFSAWFEVYLEGGWYTFDARFNIPRRGRILMALGRDASDVALTTTFGPHRLTEFQVWTDPADSLPGATPRESRGDARDLRRTNPSAPLQIGV